MNSNVYSIIVFPKSCALNNSCRRVAFSIYGCKLYTIYYYSLFLFLSSSIQFQFYFSSGMEKDGEKIKSKLKGRKKKTTKTKLRETLVSSSNFSNFETKNSEGRARREKERISPFTILEEKRYSFDFMKFEEIVGNHSTFTIENLFISENNAAVKFITSADT